MPTLTINGTTHALDVPPDMPLLWAIRDAIGLTGTKFGCGHGLCGACTVHIDGATARSCITPVSAAEGREVTTIEAVSGSEAAAVQAAWRALQVPQCGYCQSGQIMTAVALLREVPAPTDTDIDGALTGNICRCATYHRIRAAVHQAAATLKG